MSEINSTRKREIKANLLLSQNNKCFYCNVTFGNIKATIDHIISRKNGGTNKRDNLVLACKNCQQKEDGEKILLRIANRGIKLFFDGLESFYKEEAMKAFRREFQNYNREQIRQSTETRINNAN